jgi:hypothetical protein
MTVANNDCECKICGSTSSLHVVFLNRNTQRKSVELCVYSEIIDANFASKQAIAARKLRKTTFYVEIPPHPQKVF